MNAVFLLVLLLCGAAYIAGPVLLSIYYRKIDSQIWPFAAACPLFVGWIAAFVYWRINSGVSSSNSTWFVSGGLLVLVGTVVIGLFANFAATALEFLALAFTKRGRKMKSACMAMAMVFMILPGAALGSYIRGAFHNAADAAWRERWSRFLADGRTDPTPRELAEIKKNRKLRSALVLAILWGDSEYADAWEFFWKKDALHAISKIRRYSWDYQAMTDTTKPFLLLIRHGRDPADLADLPTDFLRHNSERLPLIMDNPRLRDTPLAKHWMELANSDPLGRTPEEIKEMIRERLHPNEKEYFEPIWRLYCWNREACSQGEKFDPEPFKQWLGSLNSKNFILWVRNEAGSDPEAGGLRSPELVGTLVNVGVISLTKALRIGSEASWGSDAWSRFLSVLPEKLQAEVPDQFPFTMSSSASIVVLRLLIERKIEPEECRERLRKRYESMLEGW